MSKQGKILTLIIVVLLGIGCLFLFLYQGSMKEKKTLESSGVFNIKVGEETYPVTMKDLEAIGIEDFKAIYKPSGKKAQEKTYSGVSFKGLLAYKKIEDTNLKSFVFTASDGYASGLSREEALGQAMIAVKMEGKALGSKQDGGTGPYMMVLPNDTFSQRWCKFLIEIEGME